MIGGIASGKKTYVRETLGFTDADFADAELDERPVVFNAQQLVKSNPQSIDKILLALRHKAVVICDEVGSGIIPLEKYDREWRDAVGRLCILLAKDAHKVIRMVCGIQITLKG